MKNLIMILSVMAIAFYGCEDKKKDLATQYDKLMEENDSIEIMHSQHKMMHEQMMGRHKEMSQQLMSGKIKDSSQLEELATNEVIFEKHSAMLNSHEELLNSHKTLKDGFDGKSEIEIEAQIDEMKKNHERILDEHESMKDEHDKMMRLHEDMMKQRMDTVNDTAKPM